MICFRPEWFKQDRSSKNDPLAKPPTIAIVMAASGFYVIKKHYTNGGNEGHYRIKIDPIEMSEETFIEEYELSAPIYKFEGFTCCDITIGVKEGSGFELWNGNDVASTLFDQNLKGDVVFTFEDRAAEEATLPVMRRQLEELGMKPEDINF